MANSNELCPNCEECNLTFNTASRDGYDYEVISIGCDNCGWEQDE